MQVGYDEVQLQAGDGLHIRPRVRHRMSNNSSEAARFLVISQPLSHGNRVYGTVGLVKLPL